LVQDAVTEHRSELYRFKNLLQEISDNPTVIEDTEFEAKLRALNEKVNIVLEDAKAASGGSETSLSQKMESLKEQLSDIDENLDDVSTTHLDSKRNVNETNSNLADAQGTIQKANEELDVSSIKLIEFKDYSKYFFHSTGCFRSYSK
jgi:coxsackievirus/adenovirus receptor